MSNVETKTIAAPSLDLRSHEQAMRLAKAFEAMTMDEREVAIVAFEKAAEVACRQNATLKDG